jgi:NAD-dependent deacetylase
MNCGKKFPVQYVADAPGVPRCDQCGGIVRPDVVLYEEGLDSHVINQSVNYLSKADVLIIAGLRCGLPCRRAGRLLGGKKLVLINKSPTSMDRRADLVISGAIGEVMGALHV